MKCLFTFVLAAFTTFAFSKNPDLDKIRFISPGKSHYPETWWPYMRHFTTYLARLVYDASLPESERKTWVIRGPNQNSKLVPYGILGPVMLY